MTEQYLCKYNTGRNKAIKTPKYISIIRNFFSSICYSTSIFYRCVPDTVPSVATATAETFLQSSGTQTLFEEIVADVEASWKEIIYMSLVASSGCSARTGLSHQRLRSLTLPMIYLLRCIKILQTRSACKM